MKTNTKELVISLITDDVQKTQRNFLVYILLYSLFVGFLQNVNIFSNIFEIQVKILLLTLFEVSFPFLFSLIQQKWKRKNLRKRKVFSFTILVLILFTFIGTIIKIISQMKSIFILIYIFIPFFIRILVFGKFGLLRIDPRKWKSPPKMKYIFFHSFYITYFSGAILSIFIQKDNLFISKFRLYIINLFVFFNSFEMFLTHCISHHFMHSLINDIRFHYELLYDGTKTKRGSKRKYSNQNSKHFLNIFDKFLSASDCKKLLKMQCVLIAIQLIVIVILFLIFLSLQHHHLLFGIFLFSNYVILYYIIGTRKANFDSLHTKYRY
ncbi:hypothetical protein M0811_14074 [Anaeramoeba ignava]|uniref:Uncharacterized protein n=1 Tax=Anaeramoeba ignava TaxID=1746090 RepID=A0A9Q0LXP4_ANAIG|nr:hypothetical protein M0811_14074 [Anaeramoeba ignava]